MYLRRFASIACAYTILVFSAFASAQRVDILVGDSISYSPKNTTSSEAFQPPQQTGGNYPMVGVNVLLRKKVGLNVETSWRLNPGRYNGSETFRPIFTDANIYYQSKLFWKINYFLLGGIGINNNRFYIPGDTPCGPGAGNCFVSSHHFMEHAGGGLRMYFWRRFFIGPEVHYYHIENNYEFNSSNFFRAGASIGYSFGSK
jgi:hypothetical protein